MVRILYGVSGEGFGHAARSKEIINHLLKSGHEVKVLSYDRGYSWLKSYFDTEEIFGLNFTYEANKVKYLPTIFNNLIKTPTAVRSIEKIKNIINKFKPEIVFTDYEPLTCFVANLYNLPLISLDNQHLLTKTKLEYPENYHAEALAAKIVTKLMVFNAKEYLITNFFTVETVDKKAKLLPPIVRQEVLEAKPQLGDYILVYLTSDAVNVIKDLKELDYKFKIYGLTQRGVEDNIEYKEYNQENFLTDLINCRAIIGNAGLSLICEALALKKPYLAVPAKAQFEQSLNAIYLEKLGYGHMTENLTKITAADFLSNLDYYRQALENYQSVGNTPVFKAVDEAIVRFSK